MTPVFRESFRVGLPHGGHWREAINTDAALYGGGNRGNFGGIHAEPVPWHGQAQSTEIVLPPLATVIFVRSA